MLEVGSNGGGQNSALGLTAPAYEVLHRVAVRCSSDALFDDRTIVQHGRGVVGSGTNQLHSTFHRLVIGPRPREGREKRMVDVDDPPFPLFDELRGEDLHVARQDYQIDLEVRHDPIELGLLCRLRLGSHREVMKRDSERFGDVAGVLVVADHCGDRGRDVANSPTTDEIDHAMWVLGGEDGDLLVRIHGADRPLTTEIGGERVETGSELVEVHRAPGGVEVDPQEELIVGDRLTLLGPKDVPAVLEEVGRDAGDNSRLIGAGPQEDGGFGHPGRDGSCRRTNSRAYPRPMPDLVVITGASKGLGAALARTVPFPAQVVDISRSGPDTEGIEHIAADLTRPEEWERVGTEFDRLIGTHDPDRTVMIHNAGVLTPIGFVGEVDAESYAANVLINSAAGQVLGHHFLRAVAGREGRRELIMISSGAAKGVYPGWSSYGAAKAATDQWVRNVGAEQKSRGGAVVAAIAPGVVDTGMQELIRQTDETDFPSVERFHDLHREGDLAEPETAARRVWKAIESGLDSGAVVDVRDF